MRELRDSVEDMKIKIETYVAEKRNITAEFRIQARTTISYWTEQLILKSTSGWLLSIVLTLSSTGQGTLGQLCSGGFHSHKSYV